MMGSGEGGMFFGGGFMWIFWLVILIVLFYIVKGVIGNNPNSDSTKNQTPLDILNTRFAKGEIDEEEYLRRRKELER